MARFEVKDTAPEMIETTVHINRVAKTVKGGRRARFAALMVVGDGKGNVGFGIGKAAEVPEAIRRAWKPLRKTWFACRSLTPPCRMKWSASSAPAEFC